MSEFVSSVKDDLLDRRLRVMLVVLGLALVAAIAYAVLSGGSTAATPALAPASPVAPAEPAAGVVVSEAPANPNEAVAETTSGAGYQRGGVTRNPFRLLPQAAAAATTASSTATTPSSNASSPTTSPSTTSPSTTSAPSKSSPSGSGGTSTPTSKPSAPAKPKFVYRVAVRFGAAAPGTPTASLTAYPNVTRQQPLPSAKLPLVVFRGVEAGGKSAIFTLVGEAILHGSGVCLPSAAQCQAIELKPGQTEELEYLPPSGQPIVYRLQVTSISPGTASAAIAKVAFSRESRAGRELLRRIGRTRVPDLRYSSLDGVLTLVSRRAFGG